MVKIILFFFLFEIMTLVLTLNNCFIFSVDEHEGKVDYDTEGERITVNFNKQLEVND